MEKWRLFLISCTILIIPRVEATTCGSSSDITNIGVVNHGASMPASAFSVNNLTADCYESVKDSFKELKKSHEHSKRCKANVTLLSEELAKPCSLMMKSNAFKIQFDKDLKIIDKIHHQLKTVQRFTFLKSVGTMWKLILEKLLGIALQALTYPYFAVENVIKYTKMLFGYSSNDNLESLLANIKIEGTSACAKFTRTGINLNSFNEDVNKATESLKVILQASTESQQCMNKECPTIPNTECSECRELNTYFKHVKDRIVNWHEGMEECSRKTADITEELNKRSKLFNAIFESSFKIMKAVEHFLGVLSSSLEKTLETLNPISNHLHICCPCGRITKKCDEIEVKKLTSSVFCPIEYLIGFPMEKFFYTIDLETAKIRTVFFPVINKQLNIPNSHLEIDVPKFLQECFRWSSFKMAFTKLCSLPDRPLQLKVKTPTLLEMPYSTSMLTTHRSIQNEMKEMCRKVTEKFKDFGRTFTECSPRMAIDTFTCGQFSHKDKSVRYCPCKIPAGKGNTKQENCAIVEKSESDSCPWICEAKGFEKGKKPGSDEHTVMRDTYGYPLCTRLKSYCKTSDVQIKHGTVDCSNNFIFYDGKCGVKPEKGYVCPVESIECGSSNEPLKEVCWSYPYIECSKDTGEAFPPCTCHNHFSYTDGTFLCQYGNFQSSAPTPDSAMELRNSSACFERLRLHKDLMKDCGSSMSACAVNKQPVKIYQTCTSNYAASGGTSHRPQETALFKEKVKKGGLALLIFLAILFLVLLISCFLGFDEGGIREEVSCATSMMAFAIFVAFLFAGPVLYTHQEIFTELWTIIVFFLLFAIFSIFLAFFIYKCMECKRPKKYEELDEKSPVVCSFLIGVLLLFLIFAIVCVQGHSTQTPQHSPISSAIKRAFLKTVNITF